MSESQRRTIRPRPTWKDWAPASTPEPDESELLTPDEVRDEVAGFGLRVTESEFRYWTTLDVLPHPVRRRFHGATRGTYPTWVPQIVYAAAFSHHRLKIPLPEIGPLLRGSLRNGPNRFLETFIADTLLRPIGDAALHLCAMKDIDYNHVVITYSRDQDPKTEFTVAISLHGLTR